MKRKKRERPSRRSREKKIRLVIDPDGTAHEKKPEPARPRGRPKKIPMPPPPELVEAVTRAEGAEGLAASLKAIALASLKKPGTEGYLEPKVAKVLLDLAKESRQVQMRLKAKEGAAGIVAGAFELLTTQERAVLEVYRTSKRVEPLKPGETPPPPPADDEPTKEAAP